jgi:hypothetical protein
VCLSHRIAKELVALRPDVILAHGTPATAALQRETRTIPIVFVTVTDPVGDGFVAGLPHPGGNITGFLTSESAITAKMFELLTEIAPGEIVHRREQTISSADAANPQGPPRRGPFRFQETSYGPQGNASAYRFKLTGPRCVVRG